MSKGNHVAPTAAEALAVRPDRASGHWVPPGQAVRLDGLDLLRGFAALAVLLFHQEWPQWLAPFMQRQYLAVDLFFLLSGFVLARAYGPRLANGLPIHRFVAARLVRLYPLYLLALAGSVAAITYSLVRSGAWADFSDLGAMIATGAVFLPTPPGWSLYPSDLHPLNHPAWTLSFELLVNLIFVLAAPRMSNRVLGALIACGAVCLGWTLLIHGTVNLGSTWDSVFGAFGRAQFSFFLGVALYRCRWRERLQGAPAWAVCFLAFGILSVPGLDGGGLVWLFDLLCLTVLFPMLVCLAAGATSGSRMRQVARHAGELSYPVYVLQEPILTVVQGFDRKFVEFDLNQPHMINLPRIALVVLFAWLALQLFDLPVRARLKRRLNRGGGALTSSATGMVIQRATAASAS